MKKAILLLACVFLLSFSTGDNRNEYNVPLMAWGVTAGDIDLDGDNDIVIGHLFNSQTNWTGITILKNNGLGLMELDSFYFNGQHRSVSTNNFDNNPFPDLLSQTYNNVNSQIGIIYNFNNTASKIDTFNIADYADNINIADINNDLETDIVFISTNGCFWGIIYNYGKNSFSNPFYYQINFNPNDLATDDINNDGRDDIVVCGLKTKIYFSYPDGFQEMELETEDFFIRVFIVDFDLDGLKDIIAFDDIFGAYTLIAKFKNIGGNSFERLPDIVKQPGAHVYFITDFNNDTLPDILLQLANFSGYKIYYNKGNFQLGDSLFVPVPFYGEGWRNCYCADMDGNGYQDIITTRALNAPLPANVNIMFNDGNGNFLEDPLTSIYKHPSTINNQLSCYPNPFHNEITFEFKTEKNEMAELNIYNLQGRLITCLTKSVKKGGQINYLKWDGLDQASKPCKPGPYIAYLKVNGKIKKTVKLIKTK